MPYSDVWDQILSRYNYLQINKCLCFNKSIEEFHFVFKDLYKICFEANTDVKNDDDKKEDCQLLYLSTLQLCAEIFAEEVKQNRPVCKRIKHLIIKIYEEDVLFHLVEYFIKTNNKYLRWAFVNSLAALMYGIDLTLLETWMNFIIKKLQHSIIKEESLYLIELLVSLIGMDIKSDIHETASTCKNTVHCHLIALKDMKSCFYSILSQHWIYLLKSFTLSTTCDLGEQKLAALLHLWKLILENPSELTEFPVFLDKHFVLDLLSNCSVFKSKGFILYVDLIIQIFCSSLKYKLYESVDHSLVEISVSKAISGGILESLPIKEETFCIIQEKPSNESLNQAILDEEMEVNLTSKRVAFILLSLLNEFQNMQSLFDVLEKVLNFICSKKVLKGNVAYRVINTFKDEDDLLFAVMLALLRIHIKIKKEHEIRNTEDSLMNKFLQDLNPHIVFIQFLHLLGYDHSELLSFLVSDETCCLLFLLEYLKLLLNERNIFFEAHSKVSLRENTSYQNIFRKRMLSNFSSHNVTSKTGESSLENELLSKSSSTNTSDSTSEILSSEQLANTVGDSNKPISISCTDQSILFKNDVDEAESNILCDKQLVEYSSSEEDSEKECDVRNQTNILKTVSVLENLKIGIQKLVDLQEFPYNVLPLLSLLDACVKSLR